MKIPKRFALRTLLLLMLVVAVVFGYAQWRRQWLKAEITRLNRESDPLLNGRTLPLNDDWFWPTVADAAGAVIRKEHDGTFFANGRTLTSTEAKEYLSRKADTLRRMGVRDVTYCLLIPDNRTSPPEVRIVVVHDLSELDSE